MKRLLLILTLLIPTTVMGEVVEVICTSSDHNGRSITYRFDFDKKTVSFKDALDVDTRIVPLEVFNDHLIWIEKFGWDQDKKPSLFVSMLERGTGKLYEAYVSAAGSKSMSGSGQSDCTRRI